MIQYTGTERRDLNIYIKQLRNLFTKYEQQKQLKQYFLNTNFYFVNEFIICYNIYVHMWYIYIHIYLHAHVKCC